MSSSAPSQAANGPALDPSQTPAAWTALVQDTNSAVAIFDQDGRFVFVNRTAATMMRAEPDAMLGKTLHDVLPTDVAEERLSVIRAALRDNTSKTLDGMVASSWRRATYRPFGTSADGRHLVLGVCTPTPGGGAGKPEQTEHSTRATAHDLGPLSSLTTREIEILRLIGEGLSTADIAKELHRSVKTIEWHRVALGTKLGVSNRVELARIAIRAGLVSLDKA